MSPLHLAIWIAATVAALAWLTSLITREYSWVDRIWSIIPVVYLWVFAGAAHLANARLDVMASLVTLWGARLTFNFARKGGYAKGGEDYRWAALRESMPPWLFGVFNFFFISIYQNFLLLAIALPALSAYDHQRAFGIRDAIATVIFLVLLAGETIADQQQWNFHVSKKAAVDAGRRPEANFNTLGLFRFSRHPNFFCEVAQWWVVFAFGAIAAGTPVLWTIGGAVLLTALFAGSTNFTEKISRSKYPEYDDYRRTTSAVIPWFPRHSGATEASPA